MDRHPAAAPPLGRRLAAIASLLLIGAVVVASIGLVITDPAALVAALVLFALAAVAGWYAISRSGATRLTATAALVVAAVLFLAATVVAGRGLSLVVRLALLALAAGLARYALIRDVRTLKRMSIEGTPVPACSRGVLIMNPKSGGGKAERFDLVGECRRRGIEPVVLQRGDDLLELARAAIGRGADVIGMAGGDGSQALVASVAAEAGVPMVVVPAGTRNHLALDLGIDRDDVVGALDAFGDAVERRIDLAEMNGRVFVNNVSLGLYATIVESPEYRDAKADTALAALPTMLGPGSRPFDLVFDGPGGQRIDGAHVVQISNNPYGKNLGGMTSRPSMSTGRLGVVALVIPDDRAARRFIAALTTGRPDRYEGFYSWEVERFLVDSGAPIAVGLDGETMTLEPPLELTIRPGALRLRLAPNAIGYSPASLKRGGRDVLLGLWRTALGRPVTSAS